MPPPLGVARPGETLIGTAAVDHGGSTIIVVSGDIREKETSRIVAKGLGTFSQYRRQAQ